MKLVAYTPDGRVRELEIWPAYEIEITPMGVSFNGNLYFIGQGNHGWTDIDDKYERYIKIVVEN